MLFFQKNETRQNEGIQRDKRCKFKNLPVMPSYTNFSLVCATAKLFILSVCSKTLMGGHKAKISFILAFKIAFCEVPGREIQQVNLRADTGGHHHPPANISVDGRKSSIFQIAYPLQITPTTVIRNMPPSTNKTHCKKQNFSLRFDRGTL